jgi:CubicO group peptidase (beta-lactamase class C family)
MKHLVILINLLLSFIVFQAQPISKGKIDTLIKLGRETNSSALIVIKDNKILVEEYYGKTPEPVYIASVSKALVSIAIVKLVNDGKIKSLDQPAADFYPEWKQGNKKYITIRMLLNHTSGLQNEQNTSLELEPPPTYKVKDIIALALAAELSAKPSEAFGYNNKAVALLGGIIEKASGKRMDAYFEQAFFTPMEIHKYGWVKDEVGNPTAHGAFILTGRDLAKFGELMLNKGIFKGKSYFKSHWVDSSVTASHRLDERMGLLWWRYSKQNIRTIDAEQIEKLKKLSLPDSIMHQLSPLFYQSFNSRDSYLKELENQLGKNWKQLSDSIFKGNTFNLLTLPKVKVGEVNGYYHTGYGGNYLVIIPALNLVAVRVVKRDENYNYDTDQFNSFVEVVFSLLGEK